MAFLLFIYSRELTSVFQLLINCEKNIPIHIKNRSAKYVSCQIKKVYLELKSPRFSKTPQICSTDKSIINMNYIFGRGKLKYKNFLSHVAIASNMLT